MMNNIHSGICRQACKNRRKNARKSARKQRKNPLSAHYIYWILSPSDTKCCICTPAHTNVHKSIGRFLSLLPKINFLLILTCIFLNFVVLYIIYFWRVSFLLFKLEK